MQHQLPRTIDEPPYLMFWRVDDAMMPIVGVILGIVSEWMLLCVGIGFVMSYVYQRVRLGRPEKFAEHTLYWYGFFPNRGHAMIHPYIREIVS